MYLIDTNVLIEARDRYYSFEMVPGFWSWMEEQHESGELFTVINVRDELVGRKDDLETWIRDLPKTFFLQPDNETFLNMARLSEWSEHHPNFTSFAIQEFLDSADYVLAAHACAHGFTVISQEVSAPNSKARIKLPDACIELGVECLQTFDWLRRCKPRF